MTPTRQSQIAAAIARGYALPLDTAEHIVKSVANEIQKANSEEPAIPCERCGKTIAHLINGNFTAVDPGDWGMSDDEQELCSNCLREIGEPEEEATP